LPPNDTRIMCAAPKTAKVSHPEIIQRATNFSKTAPRNLA
jgi:hypothetical protein